MSPDHDLGDDARGTGYDVILWIEEAAAVREFVPPAIRAQSEPKLERTAASGQTTWSSSGRTASTRVDACTDVRASNAVYLGRLSVACTDVRVTLASRGKQNAETENKQAQR